MRYHGHTGSKLHRRWLAMIDRCTNSKSKMYSSYGGRGITICSAWRDDFMTFYNWALANGYKAELSIDRTNNDLGYSPDNCAFVTMQEQAVNKRRRVDNNSGYIGVYNDRNKNSNGWYVQVTNKGKRVSIRYFKTAFMAALARDRYVINNKLNNSLSFPELMVWP